MYDTVDCLLVFLIYMVPFMLLLGIGGLIADYVLPHIPIVNRWLDSLPDYDDDEEE